MQVNFIKVDDHLYKITTTESTIDYNHILQNLKNASWIENPPADGNSQWTTYTVDGDPFDQHTQNFKNYFYTNKFKIHLIKILVGNSLFCSLHSTTFEHLYIQTRVETSWTKTPGQYIDHPLHVDAHTPYAYGMIYLNSDNDPNQSTWFVPWQQNTDMLYPMPTSFGTGWLVLSTEHSWHKAVNLLNEPRYSLKIALMPK